MDCVPTPPHILRGKIRMHGGVEKGLLCIFVGGKKAKLLYPGDKPQIYRDGDEYAVNILCPEDEHCNDRCDGQEIEIYLAGRKLPVGRLLIAKADEKLTYKAWKVQKIDLNFRPIRHVCR